jgi:hypothetical protein
MAQGDFLLVLDQIARNTRITANTLCGTPSLASITGGTGNIPYGFNSVSITATTVPATITFADATTYTLSTVGETLPISAAEGGRLPAFTISAGAVKWIGIK